MKMTKEKKISEHEDKSIKIIQSKLQRQIGKQMNMLHMTCIAEQQKLKI